MKNIRNIRNVFNDIIELSTGIEGSKNLKKYLLNCDFDTIKYVQAAMYLGDDEERLASTTDLWDTLEKDIAELRWESDKMLEVEQIVDKCDGKIVGEALERVINKFY